MLLTPPFPTSLSQPPSPVFPGQKILNRVENFDGVGVLNNVEGVRAHILCQTPQAPASSLINPIGFVPPPPPP